MLLTQNLGLYARLKAYWRQKYPVQAKKIEEFWNAQSGDWHWLKEKPLPIAVLNRHLWRAAVPSFSFHFLLGISSIIATLGLLANSVAIIIGAMIIAPLIGPITGIAYSTTIANRRLLRRSVLTLTSGVILTVIIAWMTAIAINLKTVTPEILVRTNPTLLDLGIALAAGSAGAFANSRRRIADALPGVAIAVALVPPLSVVGIGLALGEQYLAVGALLLFLTNLTGIVFSGVIIFLCQSYGSIQRARQGLIFAICVLFILGLPLSLSLRNLIIQNNVRYSVNEIIRDRTTIFADSEIRSIEVKPQNNFMAIEMEVATPPNSISRQQLAEVRQQLINKLNKPVQFKVKMIPVDIIDILPTEP